MTSGAERLRPAWRSLPQGIRTAVVDVIGGRFAADSPAHGGFSAGYAGVVTTTGGRAFVKACAADWHADSLRFLREEIRTLSLLPSTVGPRVLAAIDTEEGVAVVLSAIDGRHPGAPWTTEDLRAIAVSLAVLAGTPAGSRMGRVEDRIIPGFTRWGAIAEDQRLHGPLPALLRDRLPELQRLEHGFRDAVHGEMIVHDDLRADNILISEGSAHFLDWPHARRGAAWVDLPWLLPSIEATGGPPCEDAWLIFQDHGAPPVEAMLPVISGFASFLWHSQAQPEIVELPGLRRFQRRQAGPALRWLAQALPD